MHLRALLSKSDELLSQLPPTSHNEVSSCVLCFVLYTPQDDHHYNGFLMKIVYCTSLYQFVSINKTC